MSEATSDLLTQMRPSGLAALSMAAAVTLWSMTLLCANSAGYAVNPEDGSSVDGYRFVGVVKNGIDNSAGAAGDQVVEYYSNGDFLFAKDTITAADIGEEVYLVDNATVCLAGNANSTGIAVGTMVGFDSESGKVWVRINDHSGLAVEQAKQAFSVSVAGVNADALDLSTVAELYGGTGFYVDSVVSVLAIVTATNAAATPLHKVVTTHWTLAAGVLSCVGDETANTLLITFVGRLLR